MLVLLATSTPLLANQSIELHEGDIMVSTVPTARAIGLSAGAQLWPAGIVPYTIDPTLTDNSVKAIAAAIETWNKMGGISLLPVADVVELTSAPVNDFVHFVGGEYCASWVGRRGGKQQVWIAPFCPAGSVMHEIGHLLGLEHEHTRPDRDQYIQINWANIEPDKQHNFDVAPSRSQILGAYDYDSIMHYGSHNFSRNGAATITPIGEVSRAIGQRTAPSRGDILAIAQLYGIDLSLVTHSEPTEEGVELDIYVSNESAQGAHGVTVAIDVSPDTEATTAGQEDWTCAADNEERQLLCKLSVLAGSSAARLSVGLPDPFGPSDIGVSLTSKTPDLDLSNNNRSVYRDHDDKQNLPELMNSVDLVSANNDAGVLQADALARVAISGGGAISVNVLLALLTLLVGQAGRGVYFRLVGDLFSKHRWHLRRGQVCV